MRMPASKIIPLDSFPKAVSRAHPFINVPIITLHRKHSDHHRWLRPEVQSKVMRNMRALSAVFRVIILPKSHSHQFQQPELGSSPQLLLAEPSVLVWSQPRERTQSQQRPCQLPPRPPGSAYKKYQYMLIIRLIHLDSLVDKLRQEHVGIRCSFLVVDHR